MGQQKSTQRKQHIKRSGRYISLANLYRFFNQFSQANFFQFLAIASIIAAIFILFTETNNRREKAIYEAWKVLNSTNNKLSGVTILALERLNNEKYSLSGIEVQNVDLEQINLIGANLKEVNFRGSNLTKANLRGANLLKADLQKTKLREANLAGALLMGANLEQVNLALAQLNGSDLLEANLVRANLWGANLKGADLAKANLEGANLKGANLEGANLEGANLQAANLEGANLRSARMKAADLRAANLDKADLVGIRSEVANFNKKTIFPKNFKPEQRGMVKSKLANQPDPLEILPLWWGFITDLEGDEKELRLRVTIKDGFLKIFFASYGKTPLLLKNTEFSGKKLVFSLPESETLYCELQRQLYPRYFRQKYSRYVGQCRNAQDQILNIRIASKFREKPIRGRNLAPSQIDIQILEQTLEILHSESVWHQADERVCDDDEKNGSWSMFCALYHASLKVNSEYLHARPAMKEVRDVIKEITNNRPFEHRIRDYNNLSETTFNDVQKVLQIAIERLREKVR